MKKFFTSFLFLGFLISSCNADMLAGNEANNPGSSPTPAILSQGLGGISGKLERPEQWRNGNLYIYAAPYVGDPEGEGIYIFDKSLNSFTEVEENGFFQIVNLEPGYYILLVGPDVDSAIAYRENGNAEKFEVSPDRYLDIGQIFITP